MSAAGPPGAPPGAPPAEADVAAGLVCPVCGEGALPGEQYCENCGASLDGAAAGEALPADAAAAATGPAVPGSASAALKQTDDDLDDDTDDPTAPSAADGLRSGTCAQCGGEIAADGYCADCGAPAVKQRDHWAETPAEWLGGVTDRGIRHRRNEDAMALAAGPNPGDLGVLVVCDGVSSSADSDVASLAAARAARDVLAAPHTGTGSVAGRIHGWTKRLATAADAANEQAVTVSRTSVPGPDEPPSPPSCTFVAAVVDGPLMVTGWVGDSRAYWLPDGGAPQQLSEDDSWAAEQIALGMPREEAENAPLGHAITRWLGVDSPNHEPRCMAIQPDGAGWLLLCSDGLWNYAATTEILGRVFVETLAAVGPDPTRIAGALVTWANAQGGRDNITVALARIPASGEPVVPRVVKG